MARTGRPKAELVLGDAERDELTKLVRRHSTSQAMALRANIILAAGQGMSNNDVASHCHTTPSTVGKWRQRFVRDRIEGLYDEPRPGHARSITDEQVADIINATQSMQPIDGGTHWTTRLMAKHSGVSAASVARIWQAYGLQPHRQETFKISQDPLFIEKVHDVVGLYLNPPEQAVVLCVDEKSQIQALDRTQPCLPMLPTTPARRTHDYVRHGVQSLFAALDLATGHVHHTLHSRHRSSEFVKFLNQINREVPDDLAVHLVLDNYATHKTPAVKRWLLRHPRFHMHFIPTSSSWLNLVERWFGEVDARVLRRGIHRSVADLASDIRTWTTNWNDDPKPYVWVRTADEILDRLAGYLTAVNAAKQ
ncbi:IS630 family transposase [Kineococcus sp. NBC_00420]|uniref:IS630 family transposase n=1 Tax=Kineococcus sp. NBC_00420 TaxID=2903564 RepID=UPI002E1F853B